MRRGYFHGPSPTEIDFVDLKPFLPAVAFAGWLSLSPLWRQGWLRVGINLAAIAILEILAYSEVCMGRENLWLYNIYVCMQIPMTGWLLWGLTGVLWLRWAVLVAVGSSFCALCIELMNIDVRVDLLSGTGMLNDLLLTVLFSWFLFVLANKSEQLLQREPRFWMALAYLIYFGCTLPLTGLLNYLNEHDTDLAYDLYVLNDIPYVIHYALLIWLFVGPMRRWQPQRA